MIYTMSGPDLERMKLFFFELTKLAEDMSMARHPEAERLERLLERFIAPTAADRVPRHG